MWLCVSATEEEWPLLCTSILYNIAPGFQAKRNYRQAVEDLKKDGRCSPKHALLPQVSVNLWHPVVTLNGFSCSPLLCYVVVDSLTLPLSAGAKLCLMNNWWSHCATRRLLPCATKMALLLYKGMDAGREVVQVDMQSHIHVFVKKSGNFLAHFPLKMSYFLSHCTLTHSNAGMVWVSFLLMEMPSCTVPCRGSGSSVVSNVLQSIWRFPCNQKKTYLYNSVNWHHRGLNYSLLHKKNN